MKREFLILKKDGGHYRLDQDGSVVTLRADENDKTWNEPYRGQQLASIEDHGNGAKIEWNKRSVELNYSQLDELYHLLAHLYSNRRGYDKGIVYELLPADGRDQK